MAQLKSHEKKLDGFGGTAKWTSCDLTDRETKCRRATNIASFVHGRYRMQSHEGDGSCFAVFPFGVLRPSVKIASFLIKRAHAVILNAILFFVARAPHYAVLALRVCIISRDEAACEESECWHLLFGTGGTYVYCPPHFQRQLFYTVCGHTNRLCVSQQTFKITLSLGLTVMVLNEFAVQLQTGRFSRRDRALNCIVFCDRALILHRFLYRALICIVFM
jgi:hypothetical protein